MLTLNISVPNVTESINKSKELINKLIGSLLLDLDYLKKMDLRRPHPVVNFSSWNTAAVSDSERIQCRQGHSGNKDQAEVSGGAHPTLHHPAGR